MRAPRREALRWAAILVLVGLVIGRADADSSLAFKAGATLGDSDEGRGVTRGGAFSVSSWRPLVNLAFVLQREVVLARRHGSLATIAAGTSLGVQNRPDTYTGELVELPVTIRAALEVLGRSVYDVGGVYGNLRFNARDGGGGSGSVRPCPAASRLA